MIRLARFAPLLLVLLLAACMPASQGSSVRQPLPLGTTPIEVTPGETVHVLVVRTMSELGFRDTDLAPVLFRSETATRSSGAADNWMSVTPVRVPVHWQVNLAAARFVQEMNGNRLTTTVHSVIEVQVPQTSGLGNQQVRLQLNGRRSGVAVTIPFRVRQR